MKIGRIYVVVAMHGDEPFGLKVLAHLRQLGDDRIVRQVGHPEAVAKRKEYLEDNLNRCFGPKAHDSKEARIAKHLLKDISKVKPDLIIDIHTAECAVGKSAVIAKLNKDLIEVACRLGVDYVIEGNKAVTSRTLFGQFPAKAILLEYGRGLRSDNLARSIAEQITALLGLAKPKAKRNLKVYSKTRTIKKAEANGLNLKNYTFNKKLGGYPYLVGKNTYQKYESFVGFLAQKVTEV